MLEAGRQGLEAAGLESTRTRFQKALGRSGGEGGKEGGKEGRKEGRREGRVGRVGRCKKLRLRRSSRVQARSRRGELVGFICALGVS